MALNERATRLVDIVCKMSDRHLRRYLRLRQDLEAWCDQQDVYSKGESPTTAQIRKIITDSWDAESP
jgi:hypothetical protein